MSFDIALPQPSRSGPAIDFAGFQPLSVSGHINDRCLITYRAPAVELRPLLALAAGGAGLEVDTLDGEGFLSVCAVDLARMRIQGTPRSLAFDNLEMLYRLGVRLPSGASSFVTLRSDVGARPLALLGRLFSHYRPRLARLDREKRAGSWRLSCRSRDGTADAEVEADLSTLSNTSTTSRFASAEAAAQFLLGMGCSVAGGRWGLRIQPISHDPWEPRFVELRRRRFDYVEQLGHRFGIALRYDSTLYVGNVDQRWGATRLAWSLG